MGYKKVLENYSWVLESPGKVLGIFVSKRVGTLMTAAEQKCDVMLFLY